MNSSLLRLLPALAALCLLAGCPGRPPSRCGNGLLETGEQCDDGNATSGDGCEADCSLPSPVCGNGAVEGTEACDDGNQVAGDGCENTCTVTVAVRCGNGIKEGAEQCDDGNREAGDGCENDCTVTAAAGCGNGKVEAGEQCDDGNASSADGCEPNCALTTTGAVLGCAGMNEAPPTVGTCNVTPGDQSTLLTGVVLGDGKIYVGGQVLIGPAGTITCVGCDCASAAGGSTATKLVCPRGVISPGLINSHDHISFQGNPYVGTDERYEHRNDWRKGAGGHTAINNGGNATNAQVRWAELRQVMSGTTSIVGATYTANGNGGLLRNLDSSGQEGLGSGIITSDTFPLGDTSGTKLTTGCSYPKSPTAAVIPANAAYLPHIAEGIDQAAENEFLCLSQANGTGVLSSRTAMVHGIGLKAADVRLVAKTHTSLVWSPRSNISLYGDTAAIPLYKNQGVNIALGTDWTISGSMNLLRELKCADSLNTTRFNKVLSDEDLWRAVTSASADATATGDKLGRLAAGKVADLAVFRRRGTATFRSVIEAEPADVVLTLRSGKVLYGELPIVSAFDTTSSCEALDVCGAQKAVCVKAELQALPTGLPANTLASLQAANTTTYPLFSCTTPANEPSCVPERAARNVKLGSSTYVVPLAAGDTDGDGVVDATDNCPGVFNPVRPMDNFTAGVTGQADADKDGVGDVCDPCPLDANTTTCKVFNPNDVDGDGVDNGVDLCPTVADPTNLDTDRDGKGDVCDPCPTVPNPGLATCPATIYAIKSGAIPVGQRASLGNVLVTATTASGFFLQVAETEDGGYQGPNHSGIFGYLPLHPLRAGDRVDLPDVTPAAFNGQLQLSAIGVPADGGLVVNSSNNPAPLPIVVANPADLAGNDGGLSENLEGVLVRVDNVTVLSTTPDAGPGDKAPLNEFVVTGGLRVNDFLYLATPFPTVGQHFTSVTGVLEFRNGNYKLEPRAATDLSSGPAVVAALEPAQAFVREGQTGAIPLPLTVRLSNAESADVAVTVTASSGEVTIADGGLIIVPANQTSAVVPVTGVTSTDGGVVTLTATRNGSSAASTVQVLGAATPASLVSLTPTTASVSPGGALKLTVKLDLPAPAATGLTVAVAPASFGTAPATVTVLQDQLQATFDLTADPAATGAGTVTVTLGAQVLTATVTAQLAGAGHLVLSEVAPKGPASADDEFIELYNPTGQAIDISGWKLQYKSATSADAASSWATKAIVPANTSVPPRRYFLVGSSAYAGAVVPDQKLSTVMALSANAGHVRVIDDTGQVVDKLGYGTTTANTPNAPEGTAAMSGATLTGDNSYERKALPSSTASAMAAGGTDVAKGNGTDTDDNGADFVVRVARDPQSLASGAAEP